MRMGDINDLAQSGVAPQAEVVIRYSVRREELLPVRVPHDRSHLGGGDERVETRGLGRVPEVDGAVGGTAARGEEG